MLLKPDLPSCLKVYTTEIGLWYCSGREEERGPPAPGTSVWTSICLSCLSIPSTITLSTRVSPLLFLSNKPSVPSVLDFKNKSSVLRGPHRVRRAIQHNRVHRKGLWWLWACSCGLRNTPLKSAAPEVAEGRKLTIINHKHLYSQLKAVPSPSPAPPDIKLETVLAAFWLLFVKQKGRDLLTFSWQLLHFSWHICMWLNPSARSSYPSFSHWEAKAQHWGFSFTKAYIPAKRCLHQTRYHETHRGAPRSSCCWQQTEDQRCVFLWILTSCVNTQCEEWDALHRRALCPMQSSRSMLHSQQYNLLPLWRDET